VRPGKWGAGDKYLPIGSSCSGFELAALESQHSVSDAILGYTQFFSDAPTHKVLLIVVGPDSMNKRVCRLDLHLLQPRCRARWLIFRGPPRS